MTASRSMFAAPAGAAAPSGAGAAVVPLGVLHAVSVTASTAAAHTAARSLRMGVFLLLGGVESAPAGGDAEGQRERGPAAQEVGAGGLQDPVLRHDVLAHRGGVAQPAVQRRRPVDRGRLHEVVETADD